MVRQGLLFPVIGNPMLWVKPHEREVLCSSSLLIHGDDRNITFLGVLLTLVVIAAVSGLSHAARVRGMGMVSRSRGRRL